MLQAAERRRILDALEAMDESCPQSIESVGKLLEELTFSDILSLNIYPEVGSRDLYTESKYRNKRMKGRFGVLIEERFFGYPANNDSRPDFPDAGVELKTTPLKRLKKGDKVSAGERLVIHMIPYNESIALPFEASGIWEKVEKTLLVYYERSNEIDDMRQMVRAVWLFTPSEEDLAIIKQDYEIITSYVRAGRADLLSEKLTQYLGPCTKGATAEKSTVTQFYKSGGRRLKAKTRAFSLKQSYMTAVLRQHVEGKGAFDPILISQGELNEHGLDELIARRFDRYLCMTDREICEELGLSHRRSKNYWKAITSAILGADEDNVEQFSKSNTLVRTLSFENDGRLVEDLPLFNFDFAELMNEENWESSRLREYLLTTRFMLVIYQKCESGKEQNNSERVFKGVLFWSPPDDVAEVKGRAVWEAARKTIGDGVKVSLRSWGDDIRVDHNLPKASEYDFVFVRNKATKKYVRVPGYEKGDNDKYGSELPDGRWLTKPAFWLSSKYLASDIELPKA